VKARLFDVEAKDDDASLPLRLAHGVRTRRGQAVSRRRCLPVAPSVERMEVIVVRYCTGEGVETEPAHEHVAYYSIDGELLIERCTYWPAHDDETVAQQSSGGTATHNSRLRSAR